MGYEKAVKEFAPCGNECERCVSFKEGEVVRLSQALKEQLINFEHMADRFKRFMPVFNHYEGFVEVLEHFCKGNCPGCRSGEVSNTFCAAKDCHKENKVDFCYQCTSYPCNRNNYNEKLADVWENNNNYMKENGVESFYKEKKTKPRY